MTRSASELVRAGVMGLAVGDALGVPVEFTESREALRRDPVREMRSGGRYGMPKGTWSDDTSMTIATMQSIIDQGCVDPDDIMQNFVCWLYDGEFTATGESFGTGRTCTQAIENYVAGKHPQCCGGRTIKTNGNGSLMRILPVAYICWAHSASRKCQYQLVKEISSLTHAHEISVLGCYIYVNIARRLMCGQKLFNAYDGARRDDYTMFSSEALGVYDRVIRYSITRYSEENIFSSGYVVDTLEAALWCALNTYSYRDAVELAVSLGMDTDTVAAVVGSLAGLCYGYEEIPPEWLRDLQRREYLLMVCDEFVETISF